MRHIHTKPGRVCEMCKGKGEREITEMRLCGANYREVVIGYEKCLNCHGIGTVERAMNRRKPN